MKQVFVTGASRGIGAAIARTLGAEGYRVWLHYRSREDAAREVAREIVAAQGPEPLLVSFDLADRAVAGEKVRQLIATEGVPDALVLNAGLNRDGLFVFTDDKAWDDVIDTNLSGFFTVAKPVVKGMLRERRGRIVMLSSIAAQRGSPGQVNYAASKGGIIAAARSLALECAPRGITVNVVSPGLVKTDMLEGAPVEQILPLVPLQRLGRPEEVAHVVRYLCSDEAAYVTAQVINVNGGMWM
ncbi:MAG: 3-oxoacyl-ACP reductase FabG [Myxococcaceae bacterium]